MDRDSIQSEYQEHGTDEQLGKLYAALALAQEDFGEISRSKAVNVRMKEGGSYSFKYAPLEDLLAATRKALAKHNLCVLTPIVRSTVDMAKVVTVVAHSEGGRIIATFGFPPKPEIKDLAGQITYLRRYSYSAMLNLAADDDDDDRPLREERRPSSAQTANRAAQPTRQASQANSSRPVSDAPVADGELPAMVTEENDIDMAWAVRVQEAARAIGIPVSSMRIPIRRLSLLSTTNSLLVAVNNKRAASGAVPLKREDLQPPDHDDFTPATQEQIGEIVDLAVELDIEEIVDPESGQTWPLVDMNGENLDITEADRIIVLLRAQVAAREAAEYARTES